MRHFMAVELQQTAMVQRPTQIYSLNFWPGVRPWGSPKGQGLPPDSPPQGRLRRPWRKRARGQALTIGRPSRSHLGPKVKWTDLRWPLNHRCLLKLSCWSSVAIKFLVSSTDTTVGVTQRPIQGFVFLDQGVYCWRWHFLLKHQKFADFWENYQNTSVYSLQLSCSAIIYGLCKICNWKYMWCRLSNCWLNKIQ